MAWRLAKSLVKLREQVNELYPSRSKISDGAIGDAAHFKEGSASDHNPWLPGEVVSAIDITHDPANGFDIAEFAEILISSRDPRIKYMIANSKIVIPSSSTGWNWRPYYGLNAHSSHLHISVNTHNYDDESNWSIDQKGDDVINSNEHMNIIFQSMFNRNATEAEHKQWVGKKSYAELIDVLKTQKAYKDTVQKQAVGTIAVKDNWQGQIETLKKQLGNVQPSQTTTVLKPGIYEVK